MAELKQTVLVLLHDGPLDVTEDLQHLWPAMPETVRRVTTPDGRVLAELAPHVREPALPAVVADDAKEPEPHELAAVPTPKPPAAKLAHDLAERIVAGRGGGGRRA